MVICCHSDIVTGSHAIKVAWCHGVMVWRCLGDMVAWCTSDMVTGRQTIKVINCHGDMVSWCCSDMQLYRDAALWITPLAANIDRLLLFRFLQCTDPLVNHNLHHRICVMCYLSFLKLYHPPVNHHLSHVSCVMCNGIHPIIDSCSCTKTLCHVLWVMFHV